MGSFSGLRSCANLIEDFKFLWSSNFRVKLQITKVLLKQMVISNSQTCGLEFVLAICKIK